MYHVGVYGYGWSSTTTDIGACNLGLYPDRVRLQANSGRAYGYQLRCLQE
ncbi:MAG: hypothetical protein K2K83_01020 [Rikenella sp.]|nr:hypothetical protein [Rikenella sp.]